MAVRRWTWWILMVFSTLLFLPPDNASAQESELPSIQEKTREMEKIDGFLPMYWEAATGNLWLEIGRIGEEILHYTSLPAGVGSNDIGLDRGRLGSQHVVEFHRIGPRVLMVEPNYMYRADSQSEAERRAVEDAFATSVLWGFKIEAQEDERVLVDATPFLLRDAHDIAGVLRRANQGTFSLDRDRSALYLPRTRGFPQNTEIEVILTFTGDSPGEWLRSVTPTAGAVSVRLHFSFVQLPEPWAMRKADPGAGYGGVDYVDYAAPLGEPMTKRFISRHRLEKQDPFAELSDPVEPIVYYLDPGTPEPIRSALLEGARWWNEAFEAAGYRNAFQVEMMPDGADPMDVRYNVIQWVHRSTRGWSYGSSVRDPRTGEILKGHVTLGSLRVRQGYLIAEGLASPYENGDEPAPELQEMALARIRQLATHEVGHTLGLSHNYISSAQGPDGRASVMDYPHPLVRLAPDGTVDLSQAYDTGIGEWDKVAIAYGYQDFPEGTAQDAALAQILSEARSRNLTFISDQDARPQGSAHPQVHLWDNGSDAATELQRVMDVRSAALARFGQNAIRTGMPLATMEEALVPLYLHHRYQTEAAAKVVGGLYYTYAQRGDGQQATRSVSAQEQRRALDALLRTLDPGELALPRAVLATLPPRPFRYGPHRELFPRFTGLTFDAVSPASVAAGHTISLLLHPERAARLVQQEALDSSLPGLDEVIDALVQATFAEKTQDPYEAEISRVVQWHVADHATQLAARGSMPQVRALATLKLQELRSQLEGASGAGAVEDRAHRLLLVSMIGRFLERPHQAFDRPGAPDAPPGMPIGDPGLSGWELTCSHR
jgi:hypothetical protein